MDLDTAVRAPNRETLRELAERTTGAGPVLSLYLDLDPSSFSTPPARATQLTSLLNEAEAKAATLPDGELAAARTEVTRVGEYFAGSRPVEGVGALGVFCAEPAGVLEVFALPRPVPGAVFFRHYAVMGPMADLIARPSWCVLLVNRSSARILAGDEDRLEEIENLHDEVHRRHSQGGWSQARYERSVEQDVQNHVAHVAAVLTEVWNRREFDHLLVGTLSELMPEIEKALPPQIRERLRGRADVDVEHSTREAVQEATRPVMEEQRAREERALLDRMTEELGTGGRVAVGRERITTALEQGRVETLLLPGGTQDPGVLVGLTLRQGGDVRVIRHHDDLRRIGRTVALLRF